MTDISIITATFNAETTVRHCLDSVQNQQGVTVEHIIIDGGSKDRTLDMVRESGHVVKVISEPDNGIYDAMNKGVKLAGGDIVGILNADDFYAAEDTLAAVVGAFSDPEVDACYGDLVYVDNSKSSVGSWRSAVGGGRLESDDAFKVIRYWKSGGFDPRKFYWGWMPPHPTFFVRRDLYDKYGVFNLELGSAADYEIMLRFLVKCGVKAAYLPEVLVKMRTGGVSNASIKNRLAANRMDRKAWQVNGLRPYPWTLWMKPARKVGQWFVKTV
ncbi:MAG: glycosyltransferase family 2 protein [Thermodesulfobacteriota bacterium]|nr:glycosyltransferase family 2 protein [Thermodesulfobacteriota bacterium]